MSRQKYHQEIANKFAKLNATLITVRENYLEKISININKGIKHADDKDIWKSVYDDIVDLFYAALTDTYLKTSMTLKDAYNNISDKIPNIEDFIYTDDNITLPQRIKLYWDEAATLLKNPKADKQ